MNQPVATTETEFGLYVTWQDQQSRKYFPVGRLLARNRLGAQEYEFCYLRGALLAEQAGFTHFLAFPDLHQVYLSSDLFPLFKNRLMPRSRPDFEDYVHRLDLDSNATDLEILARSGGRRATDSLEVFPMPSMGIPGCFTTYFLVHGVRYLHDEAQKRIERLAPGERLRLQWDFQNSADRQAVAVRTEDCVILGYVPRYLLPDLFKLMTDCPDELVVKVQQVNPPPAPSQQRLLCRMDACQPDHFQPYATDEYLPISNSTRRRDNAT
jgi:hypothetical protein